MGVPPGGSLGASASAGACGRSFCFASLRPESAKNSIFLNSNQSLRVPTTFACPHYSSCIQNRAKVSLTGSCHLPKCWGKKPEATTKVTLTNHQKSCITRKHSSRMRTAHFSSSGLGVCPLVSDPFPGKQTPPL